MKTRFKARLARGGLLLVLAAAGLAASGGAQAAATAAGTTISNKATLNYSVGGVGQPPIVSSPTGSSNSTGASTDFLVDNKISHTVTTTDGSAITAVPGQTNVVTSFSVSNTGNATQDYALTIANLGNGSQSIYGATQTDTFDVTLASCTIKVNGVAQGYIGSLAAGSSVPVTVTCPIPAAQANNDLAGIVLTAQAATAGSAGATLVTQTNSADTAGVVDIVFADTAGSDDVVRDGKGSARSAYKVVTSTLVVSKTAAAVCDPFNGSTNPKNIPGAFVKYTVTIVNGGSASATLTTVTDVLSANVDFDPDMISGAGAATNCATNVVPTSATGSGFSIAFPNRGATYPKFYTSASDSDGATFTVATGTLTVDFVNALPAVGTYAAGELKAGDTLTLIYQVKIK